MQLLAQLMPPKDPEANDIFMRTGCTEYGMGIDEMNKKIYFANAGDSRVVYCSKGKAEEGSQDHKPEMEMKKIEYIKQMDGLVKEE